MKQPFLASLIILTGLLLSQPAEAAWNEGLLGGYASRTSNEHDLTVQPANTNIWPCTSAATNTTSGGSGLWDSNRCWIYWGQIYLPTGNWSIASHNDDTCYILIDDTLVHNQNSYAEKYTTNAFVAAEAGWYDFEVRMGNDGGGAGPSTTALAEMGGAFGLTDMIDPPLSITDDYTFPDGTGEILFRYDDGLGFDDALLISGTPANYGIVIPPYPVTNGLDTGDSFLCSAPAGTISVDEGIRVKCAGYAIYTNDTILIASGTTNAFTYTHDLLTSLVWQWDTEVEMSFTAGTGGSVSTLGGWYADGSNVTVTANADSGYTFSYWTGDFPTGQAGNNTLSFSADRPRTVAAVFASTAVSIKFSGGAGDGFDAAVSTPTSLGDAPISLTLTTDQIIERTWQAVPCGTITITDSSPAAITAANDLRLTISDKLLQTWDTTVVSPTFSGSGAGSIASVVSYENDGKTLVVDVTSPFSDGATLSIDGLAFTNLIQACIPERLALDIDNNGVTDAWSDAFIGVTMLAPGGFGDGGTSFTMTEDVPLVIPRETIILIR